MLVEAIAYGGFGLIIGSFLNVLILRRATGKTLSGRSACASCGATLRVRDLVPVFSWVLLRGRCAHCGCAISPQYPLVEALTATLFIAIGLSEISLAHLAPALVAAALLIAIAAYDVRHTIIPDAWVWLFNASAILSLLLSPLFPDNALQLLLAGPIVALPLAALWLFSGGRWMGLGDAKLALGIGWFLGVMHGLGALLLSFVIGALVSVFILLPLPRYAEGLRKLGITSYAPSGARLTMGSEVPFGPFLATAFIIVWLSHLYGIDILSYGLWNVAHDW
ncbi:hypothetical protein COU20_01560 [Candidatus Kaiserbacteria bacterium CG10_big_fil_rev_8_21_14_0_10_59_10]|uniref:Prepilin peptidase n=1 Tax=Candidatus Kaiserbacteria bacterium CG10_big_fil_rev_8_21_14_0_10_59_10 TaxID=1974612 RepID=A0A2H0U886_9BACT|nr:MAG: hypothetical protein COU20_01560 [Candidatus Kaiserbacteria bacterium CG10_big_fil_rev_8_21_14_0_10_59_10]